MTETEKAVNDARLKAVEEAVIKFGNIADIVLVDLKKRVRTLEQHDEDFQKTVSSSCELKTREISASMWKSIAVTGALFLLFVGAVVHFNAEDGKIYDKINKHYEETVKTKTLNETVIKSLDKFDKKLDNLTIHKHDNSATLKRVSDIEKYQNRNFGFLQGSKRGN